MKFPTMFSPVQIGTVTVPNRFVVPPMGNNLANTDGSLSDRSLAYYQARAKGGFGLITIESTVVYQEAKGGPRKPCLFSDDTVESFRRVADACHAYGAKVSIQLQHAGPEGNSALTGYPLKAASAVPARSTSASRTAANCLKIRFIFSSSRVFLAVNMARKSKKRLRKSRRNSLVKKCDRPRCRTLQTRPDRFYPVRIEISKC